MASSSRSDTARRSSCFPGSGYRKGDLLTADFATIHGENFPSCGSEHWSLDKLFYKYRFGGLGRPHRGAHVVFARLWKEDRVRRMRDAR